MGYDGSLKFDTKIDSAGFTRGVAELKSSALSAVAAIGAAFSAGAIAKALVGQISLVEQYGSAINDQAQKLSISKKAYQELSYMFTQTGGNADTLQMGMKTLSNAVVDGSKAFDQLGISLDRARMMSSEDLFNTVINKLAGMEEGTKRTALATDLFGRSATELNPLLNMGADGLAKMRQEAANYGLIMTDEAVAATDEYGDSVELAKQAGDALRNAMVGKMLPALTGVAMGFADIARESTTAFNQRGIAGVVDVITDRFPVATAAVGGLVTAFTAMVIINTVQEGMTAFAATEALLTAATQYGTLAQWQELGALTVKQIVVAALTGKISAVTAAQWLWNAAISANPVMLLVVAIGALVGAITLVQKGFEKAHPEIYETRDAIDALNKSMDESKKTFDDTLVGLDKQKESADQLVSSLLGLSQGYTGSANEQFKMQAIINDLNASYSNLDLSFDKNTGKLSQNAAAIHEVIDAQIEAARTTAMMDRYTQLLTDIANAEYDLWKARKEQEGSGHGALDAFAPWNAAASESEQNIKALEAALAALNVEQSDFVEFLDSQGIKIPGLSSGYDYAAERAENFAEKQGGLNDKLGDTGDKVDRIIIGGYDFTDSLEGLGMTADEVAGRLDNFSGAAQNMFGKINTKSKVSVKSMIDNLNSNTAAMEQWGANIATLGAKLPADLLQPLVDQGPEKMAGVLNNLAGASDADLAKLTEAFANGGDAAKQAWLESLGAGLSETESPLITAFDGVESAAADAGTAAGQALVTAINAQDYSGATSGMTASFKKSFSEINVAFDDLLCRIHYNLATATGGVKSDILDMTATIKRALAEIPTNVTISVNVLYNGASGGTTKGGFFGPNRMIRVPLASGMDNIPFDEFPANLHKGEAVLTAQEASAWRMLKGYRATAVPASSSANAAGVLANALRVMPASGGGSSSIYAPITVEGRVESDAQLSRRIRNEFSEVIMNGRR